MGEITWEFKIVSGSNGDVQKIINQWKHEYTLKIQNCVSIDKDSSKIFLVRTKRVPE